MDKVQKHNSFNTNTPSSESYRNYLKQTTLRIWLHSKSISACMSLNISHTEETFQTRVVQLTELYTLCYVLILAVWAVLFQKIDISFELLTFQTIIQHGSSLHSVEYCSLDLWCRFWILSELSLLRCREVPRSYSLIYFMFWLYTPEISWEILYTHFRTFPSINLRKEFQYTCYFPWRLYANYSPSNIIHILNVLS